MKAFLLLVIIGVVCVLPAPVSAAASVQSLPVGSYWSGSCTILRSVQGKGTDSGTWSGEWKQTYKFSVVSRDANTVAISYEYSGSWSSTATDTWISPNKGATTQGTVTPTRCDYTIDVTTRKVTAVSKDDEKSSVGGFTWFFTDAEGLRQGGTVSMGWYGPVVPWTVGSPRTVNIRGVGVEAYPVTYTGDSNGYWHVGSDYPKGKEVCTYVFDKTYGIVVGIEGAASYTFTRQGGGWTETYYIDFKASDSNIGFSQPSAFTFLLQPYVIGGILAAAIAVAVALFVIRRRKGRPTPPAQYAPIPPPAQVPPAVQVQPPVQVPPPTQVPSAVQPAMKYCIECGASIPARAKHCSKCGATQE